MSCRLTGSSSTTIMFSGIQAGLSSLAYRGGMLKKEYSTGVLIGGARLGTCPKREGPMGQRSSWLKGRARSGEVQVHGAGLQRNFTSRTFQLTTKMRRLLLLPSAGKTKKTFFFGV